MSILTADRLKYSIALTCCLLAAAGLNCNLPALADDAGSASTGSVASTATTAVLPAAAPTLRASLSDINETLRRMKGEADDILHEVSRTEAVMPNGQSVDAIEKQVPPQVMGMYMTGLDAMSHDALIPPRPHWLNNSLSQMLDLQSKLQADSATITKIVGDPEFSSGGRAQGMVLTDIIKELAKNLGDLEVAIRETPPKNININVAAHKIAESISGMESVSDRLWKEAPHKFKSR